MNAIRHLVAFQRFKDRMPDFFKAGDVCKHQGMCALHQPVEVLLHLVDLAIGDSETFPNGIPTLHHAVQHTDFGVFAKDGTIHPAPCAGVAWIRLIEFGHGQG